MGTIKSVRFDARVASFLAALLACLPLASADPPREKTVWNYDGGVILETDGSVPDGPCFRIKGRLMAPQFFDNLKRVDTKDGALFRRGAETVDTFPDRLILAFVVFDHPCSLKLERAMSQAYLTRSFMQSLKFFLYWKRGIELRPVSNAQSKFFAIDPVVTHSVGRSADLPEKFVWSYEFAIPSGGVPLTDSLVLVLRDPNGRIAARGAARM